MKKKIFWLVLVAIFCLKFSAYAEIVVDTSEITGATKEDKQLISLKIKETCKKNDIKNINLKISGDVYHGQGKENENCTYFRTDLELYVSDGKKELYIQRWGDTCTAAIEAGPRKALYQAMRGVTLDLNTKFFEKN